MGRFEHKQDNTIVVNSVRIPLGLFLMMEPSYRTPVDCRSQVYIQGKGRRIVDSKGGSHWIDGAWSEGDRYISRQREFESALMSEKLEFMDAIRQVKSLSESAIDKRRMEYPPVSDLIVALWKHIVEGKSQEESGVTALQEARKAVKSKYPKETSECQQSTHAKDSSITASGTSVRRSSRSMSMKNKLKTE